MQEGVDRVAPSFLFLDTNQDFESTCLTQAIANMGGADNREPMIPKLSPTFYGFATDLQSRNPEESQCSKQQSMNQLSNKDAGIYGPTAGIEDGFSPLARYGTATLKRIGLESSTMSSKELQESHYKRWWRDRIGRFGTKRKAGSGVTHDLETSPLRGLDLITASAENIYQSAVDPFASHPHVRDSPESQLPFPAPGSLHSDGKSHSHDLSLGKHRSKVPKRQAVSTSPQIENNSFSKKTHNGRKGGAHSAKSDFFWAAGSHVSTPAPSSSSLYAPVMDADSPSRRAARPRRESAQTGHMLFSDAAFSEIDAESSPPASPMSRSPSARGSINSITMVTTPRSSYRATGSYEDEHNRSDRAAERQAEHSYSSAPLNAVEMTIAANADTSYSPKFQSVPTHALSDYEPLITLGTGTFGRVLLVRHKNADSSNPSSYMALKVLNKANLVLLKQVSHINAERAVLSKVEHPFIVNLFCTYQDSVNCYMLMEFVVGGEVFTHLRKAKRFSVGVTRFYIASLVLALAHLHSKHILYRDLKPENLLLDSQGYIKVADFGFAKELLEKNERAWTLCGTPEYLSPEVIQSKGQTFASDYWALGILMFEMLCGYPPFYGDRPFLTYEKILQGNVNFPAHVDPMSRALIQSLLSKDVSRRLGNLSGGALDVMYHPWFEGVDWQALLDRRIPAPFVPKQAHAGDTTNFQQFDDYDITTMPGLQGTEETCHVATMQEATTRAAGDVDVESETDPYRLFFLDF